MTVATSGASEVGRGQLATGALHRMWDAGLEHL
jgi:hypothetical protein